MSSIFFLLGGGGLSVLWFLKGVSRESFYLKKRAFKLTFGTIQSSIIKNQIKS
jgi:hypothetical protein